MKRLPKYTPAEVRNDPYGFTYKEMSEVIGENEAKALYEELYKQLPRKKNLSMLVKNICKSSDTEKYVYELKDNKYIETVFIKRRDGGTVCVSTQVGCPVGCIFCESGRNGFVRNLTSSEIVQQIILLRRKVNRIVFMGMGEPLDNVDELFKALEILTSSYGYGWSPKRITVSTIGVAKGLERFLAESDCHLAVSMHTPFPSERLSIMPVEKAFPIKEVIDKIKQHDFTHQRRVSFEYIMFDGLNDDLKHAEGVAKLVAGLSCRINLIRFHAIPDSPLKSSNTANMNAFRDALTKKGIVCTIRSSRGEDIFAACGMLSTAKKEQKL